MRHAIVTGKAENDCSADAPDRPGCIATGESVTEVERGMGEDGRPVPAPTSLVSHVEAGWHLRSGR